MIYADNAATSKISDLALQEMLPFLRDSYGNPSSAHLLGHDAKQKLLECRKRVSECIGASDEEIYFTSGGTEGNNWVLNSIGVEGTAKGAHIVTSCIEHDSVIKKCEQLTRTGVSVTYLPVNRIGKISLADLERLVRPNTKLVSIMFANNEIGNLQPIAEIGSWLSEKGINFHTDAVQAVGHLSLNLSSLPIDFLTSSAHKFNGPKGVGFLYIKKGLFIPPFTLGGGQEMGMRAGTENVPAIVGLAAALEESTKAIPIETYKKHEMVQLTIEGLKSQIQGLVVNGGGHVFLPGILNVMLPEVSGESMVHLLSMQGICVSAASACNTGSHNASHVLLGIGLSEKNAKSCIRISYGKYNKKEDVYQIVNAIAKNYKKLRAL